MITAPRPDNELERLSAINDYKILDTLPEKEYDDITRIAAEICGTPISLLTIVDRDRQWFKSRIGLEEPQTKRDYAFCAHAILNPNEIFIVDNPSDDDRFHDNPLVTGDPHIAFYAGVPLVTNSGAALGTLCVIDNKPRELSASQKTSLSALARQLITNLEIRKMNRQLEDQHIQLEKINEDLSRFAQVVAHDIKSPCSSLAMGIPMFRDKYARNLDNDGKLFLNLLEQTALSSINMVNGILEHTSTVNKSGIQKERFTLGSIIGDIRNLINIPPDFLLEINNNSLWIYSSRSMLIQIIVNLCNNAIKYNDKENGLIFVSAVESNNYYQFSVKDNGPGISEKDHEKIFDLFYTLGVNDRYNNKGTGIGLATVKRLVEKLQGKIEVVSTPGLGCSFDFTISK